jgi:cytochrome P450
MRWLKKVVGWFSAMGAALKMRMLLHMEQHPKSPLPLFAALRRWKPNLVFGNFAIVTKAADVQEVMSRSDAFRVTLYPPRMEPLTGLTPLVMDDTPEYHHDSNALRLALAGPAAGSAGTAALQRAICPEDKERIRDFVNQTAAQIVDEAKPAGRIDLVQDLANTVPIRLCANYFGTPGIDDATQLRWARTLFFEMFIVQGTPVISREAMDAAAAWKDHTCQLMAQRRADLEAGKPVPDDILGRLLRQQSLTDLEDDRIWGNLIHMTVGFLPQVAKVTALAVEELIDRPEQLAQARKAARADDDELLGAYLWESLRFNAHPALLFRQCAFDSDYVLAEGTSRATRIPAGTLTLAALQSAMFDEEALDCPQEFRVDRPWEQYLFFGLGQHQCLGQHISRLAVPLIAKPLLRQHQLRRAPGSAGRMAWETVFPDRMIVEFAPAA